MVATTIRARLAGAGLRALGPQASDFGGSACSGLQAWAGASRGLGPGSQSGSQKFFVALKSLLLGGWRRGGSQLNNYDETRSDHGPVGITWLCYILVTIDYATYLSPRKKLQEINRCKKCQDHHAGQPVGSTWLCYILVAIDYATDL